MTNNQWHLTVKYKESDDENIEVITVDQQIHNLWMHNKIKIIFVLTLKH